MAANVVVTANIVGAAASGLPETCELTGTLVECEIVSLAPGSTATFSFGATRGTKGPASTSVGFRFAQFGRDPVFDNNRADATYSFFELES